MWFLILFGVIGVVMLALAWNAASPTKSNRRDTSTYYGGGDTASSGHIHSDHCGHGHDGGGDTGGSDGGGDCGGGDGGGGSD